MPILPVALAVAINAFTYQETRDAYRRVVLFTGIGAGLFWLPLFSLQYDGLSGIFGPYAEPSHLLALLFNATHLLAETLIGARLFAAVDAVLAKYAPSLRIDNPARRPIEEALIPATAELDAAVAARAALAGQRNALMGLKGSAHILVETAIRQKRNERSRDSLI